ncbi:hypothetical protein D3C72_747610 [compost metagenome]
MPSSMISLVLLAHKRETPSGVSWSCATIALWFERPVISALLKACTKAESTLAWLATLVLGWRDSVMPLV